MTRWFLLLVITFTLGCPGKSNKAVNRPCAARAKAAAERIYAQNELLYEKPTRSKLGVFSIVEKAVENNRITYTDIEHLCDLAESLESVEDADKMADAAAEVATLAHPELLKEGESILPTDSMQIMLRMTHERQSFGGRTE